ncbi:hypothetical protein NPIL_161041 [Nephila pilipes]|uniref:Uncharacterized protein n=1 Tax=Nephila pilipes TaxID=299642 RepID=A0A8X6T3N1_NEPPI|nr:hypothetical protein NPIL_161041 [Nephila pilipes]
MALKSQVNEDWEVTDYKIEEVFEIYTISDSSTQNYGDIYEVTDTSTLNNGDIYEVTDTSTLNNGDMYEVTDTSTLNDPNQIYAVSTEQIFPTSKLGFQEENFNKAINIFVKKTSSEKVISKMLNRCDNIFDLVQKMTKGDETVSEDRNILEETKMIFNEQLRLKAMKSYYKVRRQNKAKCKR